ncbi:MAG: serine hydroxymethyltransferase [Dehalococcoidia bacterium]|nr:serine hydroxymethyltransferase [Dehalococcoidia bacterium]
MHHNSLDKMDPVIAAAIAEEHQRQFFNINLIAAENYASPAVLEAQGCLLTNKYAEGYPGHRYYGGCDNTDRIEQTAIQRARELYGAEHANVQPHSGAQANMAAYFALLQPGDTIMAMSLAHGGHLTHGGNFNFSGRLYSFVTYEVDRQTETLDYDNLEKLALACRPRLIVAGASSYTRQLDFARFRQIADRVGSRLMVDMAHLAGLVAGGVHPSPVPFADVITSTTHKTLRGPRGGFILSRSALSSKIDSGVFPGTQGGPLVHVIAAKAVAFHEAMLPEFKAYQEAIIRNAKALADELGQSGLRLVSGGTDNHIVLLDLTRTGITGNAAEKALDSAGITVNKNVIPFDPRAPQIASGIRLGTPAITTRGLGLHETRQVGRLIVKVLSNVADEKVRTEVRNEVNQICQRFPPPGVN